MEHYTSEINLFSVGLLSSDRFKSNIEIIYAHKINKVKEHVIKKCSITVDKTYLKFMCLYKIQFISKKGF